MQTCSQNKRNLTSNVLLGIIAVAWFAGGLYWVTNQPKGNVVVYDCGLSEISPDFPLEVREACRKLRANNGWF